MNSWRNVDSEERWRTRSHFRNVVNLFTGQIFKKTIDDCCLRFSYFVLRRISPPGLRLEACMFGFLNSVCSRVWWSSVLSLWLTRRRCWKSDGARDVILIYIERQSLGCLCFRKGIEEIISDKYLQKVRIVILDFNSFSVRMEYACIRG